MSVALPYLARGTRLAAVVLVPAALLLIALQQPIAHLLFGYTAPRIYIVAAPPAASPPGSRRVAPPHPG